MYFHFFNNTDQMCKKKNLYITLRTWGLPLEEKGPNIQKKCTLVKYFYSLTEITTLNLQ